MDYHKFVGEQVIHVHRQYSDGTYQTGRITGVSEGVNTLIDVQWKAQEYSTATPPQDIALESTYPESRWGAE